MRLPGAQSTMARRMLSQYWSCTANALASSKSLDLKALVNWDAVCTIFSAH